MGEPLTTALETVAASKEHKTVLDLLDRMGPEITKALPQHLDSERFRRIVVTELRRTPKLYECDPTSLLGAVMLSAQLGLEPGPLGHVYLVPFRREVEFIIGYRGYIDLAYRSGQVKDVAAALVHEGDHFTYRYGTRPVLDHVPAGPAGERAISAAYGVARLKTGGTVFNVIYEADWELARKRSPAGSKSVGPWDTDRAAMIRKTAVRRLEPLLPKSPVFAQAIARDEAPAPTLDESAVIDAEAVENGG